MTCCIQNVITSALRSCRLFITKVTNTLLFIHSFIHIYLSPIDLFMDTGTLWTVWWNPFYLSL